MPSFSFAPSFMLIHVELRVPRPPPRWSEPPCPAGCPGTGSPPAPPCSPSARAPCPRSPRRTPFTDLAGVFLSFLLLRAFRGFYLLHSVPACPKPHPKVTLRHLCMFGGRLRPVPSAQNRLQSGLQDWILPLDRWTDGWRWGGAGVD